MAAVVSRDVFLLLLAVHVLTLVAGAAQLYHVVNDDGTCSNLPLNELSSGKIESQNGSTYPNGTNCQLTWNATAGTKTLVILTFDLADAQNGTCVDRLEIYDPADEANTKQTLCGTNATNQVFEFSVPIVTFSLVTDAASSHNGTGFTALVTSFSDASTGSCSGSKFLCDTDRCISDSLECDGDQNCGDQSDESSCSITSSVPSTEYTTDQSASSTTDTPSASSSPATSSQSTASSSQSPASTSQSPISLPASAVTPSSLLALGDKAVLVIIILASATIVTIIITAIIYTVWCKNNSVHPDVESIEVKEAPVSSRAHRDGPTTSRAPPTPAATKAAPKLKAPAPREPEASPAKKGPAKKGKMLKKDAW